MGLHVWPTDQVSRDGPRGGVNGLRMRNGSVLSTALLQLVHELDIFV